MYEINTILQDNVFDITHGNPPDLPKIAKIIFNNLERKIVLEKFIHSHTWAEGEHRVNTQGFKRLRIVESTIITETKKAG